MRETRISRRVAGLTSLKTQLSLEGFIQTSQDRGSFKFGDLSGVVIQGLFTCLRGGSKIECTGVLIGLNEPPLG